VACRIAGAAGQDAVQSLLADLRDLLLERDAQHGAADQCHGPHPAGERPLEDLGGGHPLGAAEKVHLVIAQRGQHLRHVPGRHGGGVEAQVGPGPQAGQAGLDGTADQGFCRLACLVVRGR
jgi:hypothetical protein